MAAPKKASTRLLKYRSTSNPEGGVLEVNIKLEGLKAREIAQMESQLHDLARGKTT